MSSLTEAFLIHGAMAYPCGKVSESKKMLNELPDFRNVNWAKTSLRTTLTKGSSVSKKRSANRE
ncbi:MAG: hypothetical protein J6T55_00705 [Alphaproteobacteria bacterium]|nr:hypothetical protein [Alphaproteobacteria bacterium]